MVPADNRSLGRAPGILKISPLPVKFISLAVAGADEF